MVDDGSEDYPKIVATVRVEGFECDVRCTCGLTRQEANLLFVLGEHVSRLMALDDICHRMKMNPRHLRVQVCLLKKKLHYDWIIQTVANIGMRLCYLGTPLSEADLTNIEIKPIVHGRVGLTHSKEVKLRIQRTQIETEAWRHFYS